MGEHVGVVHVDHLVADAARLAAGAEISQADLAGVADRDGVVGVVLAQDVVQFQLLEAVLAEQPQCLGAQSHALVLLLADGEAHLSLAVLPVDVHEAAVADQLVVGDVEDREDPLRGVAVGLLHPADLLGQIGLVGHIPEMAEDLRVVEPFHEVLGVIHA